MSENGDQQAGVTREGITVHPVDASGRITLKEHQDERMPRLVHLTQGLDRNILVLQEHMREQIGAALGQFSPLDPDAVDLRRMFLAPITDTKIDGQRRLKISEALRDWAGLEGGKSRALVLDLGAAGFEIWEEERYRTYMSERAPALKEVARRLLGSGKAEEAEDEQE